MLDPTGAPPADAANSRAYLRLVRAREHFPKGVRFQAKALKDGTHIHYGYYGRGSESIALGRLGTAEFDQAIAGLKTRAKTVAPGSLRYLVWRYKTSTNFANLRAVTKQNYRLKLDLIQSRFGELPLAAVEAQNFSAEIFAWRDELAATPRQADYGVQVLKLLLSWGCRRGLIEVNRAARVDRLQRGKRGGRSWSQEQIDAFLATAPPPMRLAMILALETGQRQGDLLRLQWSSVDQELIQLVQSKTGVHVAVPISPSLQAALAAQAPPRAGPVLVRANGRPWDKRGNGFRNAWRIACQTAGVTNATFHDLRGTFITRKLAEGWSPIEVAMCTGHALRDLASLDFYADRAVLARALAERRFAVAYQSRAQPPSSRRSIDSG